ncbi:IucA/IucC family siderophore biosynthesis protein [Francisella tularensis]|uniref:rhizoferrin biosynthesis protein FslA n=1 Tax=Francisella tularensis TaxID=263 RepID=UPI00028ED45A|nr:rhizoferrin biosynthesis protein FslA [Francisella tularensis]EKM89231.1 IucA/IucC family siderophore biosynthesis protein [Francisella tularensis subsp. tularensis 831]EKM89322.1 IucA/IucC family siderophore biosynthesis protein [Francisella tularensis subsp. tularensis AS_713]EKM93362.1 IucA/IucC family siderophore biosynthesis protein [Francisella tularensis subsp. tularensis 80700103]EKT90526.1 IucA/IucC family siderophore biosynthesis protein [Francisella tularensis subsp. tularensis 70
MHIEQLQKNKTPLNIETLELIGLITTDLNPTISSIKASTLKNQFKRVALSFYREGLLGKSKKINDTLFFYNINNDKILKINNPILKSLNRIELPDQLTIQDCLTKRETSLENIEELINWAKDNNPQINHDDWQQFEYELDNSFENELSMNIYRGLRQKQLANTINSANYLNLWQWLTTTMSKNQQLAFLEQWGAVGHIYHPSSKTKIGLSKFENILYSPEFENEVNIIFGAIHKNIAHIEIIDNRIDNYQNWMIINYPEQYKIWYHELDNRGLDSNNYLMIPIHPWQAEHILPAKHKCLIDCQQLIIINDCKYTTKPSMSFRTMLPVATKDKTLMPHIKLPVAIHATSVTRTVSPESVKTGPRISKILLEILAKENHLAKNMDILADIAGIHTTKACRKDDIRQLSAIFRTNPEELLDSDEVACPLASLFVKTPQNQALICDILELLDYNQPSQILAYFRKYTQITLTACLDLYLLYGIALEAHQQNTLVVFKENMPQKLLIRDLGGMRLHLPSFEASGFHFPKDTFSLTFTNSQTITRRKFIHACLQSNIGELVIQLSSHYKIAEGRFWTIVKGEIHQRFEYLKPRISPDKYKQEYTQILEKPWSIKALTRMRLNDKLECDKDDMQGDIYINLKNPLA